MLKYKQKKEAANELKKGKKKKVDMEQGELKPLIEMAPESEDANNAKAGGKAKPAAEKANEVGKKAAQ